MKEVGRKKKTSLTPKIPSVFSRLLQSDASIRGVSLAVSIYQHWGKQLWQPKQKTIDVPVHQIDIRKARYNWVHDWHILSKLLIATVESWVISEWITLWPCWWRLGDDGELLDCRCKNDRQTCLKYWRQIREREDENARRIVP